MTTSSSRVDARGSGHDGPGQAGPSSGPGAAARYEARAARGRRCSRRPTDRPAMTAHRHSPSDSDGHIQNIRARAPACAAADPREKHGDPPCGSIAAGPANPPSGPGVSVASTTGSRTTGVSCGPARRGRSTTPHTSSSPASTKSGGRPPRLPASAGEQSGCRSCAFVAYSWICDLIGAAVPSACVMYSGRACHGPLASTDSPAFLLRKRRSRPVERTNAPASRGSGHKTLGRCKKLYGGM